MQNHTRKTPITSTLDDLIKDTRLMRLFSIDGNPCALQLWVLQLRSEQSIENRIVYGRLLPYNHSNDFWSATADDNFQAIGDFHSQIIKLNLYIKSPICSDLLRQLCTGITVSEISDNLNIGLSDDLRSRLGAASLTTKDLAFRPVAYLLNRDAHERRFLSSPHGGAGALSASITQLDKNTLFRLNHGYDSALAAFIIERLNADTGLDFGSTDAMRLGDIELLVFPALDDQEQELLHVNRTAPETLVVQFNPMQVPYFKGFQFHINIINDNQIIYSRTASSIPNEDGIFEYTFELNDHLHEITDSTALEVFGVQDSGEGVLCCKWRIGYIRQIHFQGHVAGHGGNSVKFDWLERATRPAAATRVKAALTIKQDNLGFADQIGGRSADPWAPINRDLVSLLARLHPSKSDGQFFLRWGQGDGEGRLQFVEWFKSLFSKYQEHQIAIFDPYFDTAGLGLTLLCAAPKSKYIVFTTLPKPAKDNDPDTATSSRINNLVASCERNPRLMQSTKLRIYGLKEGRLHDRYILIVAPDGLPIVGFNLSNSLQSVAENHPLLITPIPPDVLLKVEQYQSSLVQEAQAIEHEGELQDGSMKLLFDSSLLSKSVTRLRRYEPLQLLENEKAGDVLSALIDEPSLKSLSGSSLKEKMVELGLLNNTSLALPNHTGLQGFLKHYTNGIDEFTEGWNVLGDILASSRVENHLHELEVEHEFLNLLEQFLEASFNRKYHEADRELAVLDTNLFRYPLDTLLHRAYKPHHLSHATLYSALNWSEYFSIKILWAYSPSRLIAIAEAQMPIAPIEPQAEDAVQLSLLSQIVSEISTSVQFGIDEERRTNLLRSSNGLLKWLGLTAVEQLLDDSEELPTVLHDVGTFPPPEKIRALGWMVNHAARTPERSSTYAALIKALHKALPPTITAQNLKLLVDSMRGHMHQLSWTGIWLFQDVIFPLLQKDRVNNDDACGIWMQELILMLEPKNKNQPLLFNREREGHATNVSAFLLAYSSANQQESCLTAIRAILRRQQRIIQQPLASTSNWSRWDDALTVSLWILTFIRWLEYYLRERSIISPEVEELSQQSRTLAMIRPITEWRSVGVGRHGDLAALLDQADGLLASNENSKSLDLN